MKTTIGGDRLGSGNKQNVSIKNFGRSSHDLSYIWRSSMASGTLVPFMSEVGLPGDSFDINLDASVLTLPTVGPLFGSYKVQMDVFACPIRLYNGKLHMNKLGIGMDMSQIKLPQLLMEAWSKGGTEKYEDNEQVNASSIFSYLNMRGIGKSSITGKIFRSFNALSYLSYWDIYKQYYANKQEEKGVVIHGNLGVASDYTTSGAFRTVGGESPINIYGATLNYNGAGTELLMTVNQGTGRPNWNELYIVRDSISTKIDTLYATLTLSENDTQAVWSDYIGASGNVDWTVNEQTIGATDVPYIDGKPILHEFPLENIDTMRENILSAVSQETAFIIDSSTIAPYGTALESVQDSDLNWYYSQQFGQEGLGIKTYQSDLFNNWISTEWIDGTNGVNEVTAVAVEDGKFTIDALNLANKVYNMLNRIAISGGSYDDWLDAVYTHERAKSVESPVYQGSLIKELVFQEVVSTAEAGVVTDQPLGTLAGKGRLSGKNKGGKIKVKCDEPCYIMGIASITPKIDYSQGNRWDCNLKTMNDFHKPSLDAIGYQDLITDQMAWFDTDIAGDGTPTFKSAGKQPAWINYMTNVNVVRGNFAEENNSMFMVLNRRYENSGITGIGDLTTYVDPSKFNHIFADTRLDAQNFWVQISNDMTVRRKISAKVIPNL